jgi:uncharacterized lipoprotein YddW (UPF0748 family)
MKRLLCACLLAVMALASLGCTLLRRTSTAPKKPKPVTAVAADTDNQFRALWIAQRRKELEADGLGPTAAATKAGEEYVAKYGYTASAR